MKKIIIFLTLLTSFMFVPEIFAVSCQDIAGTWKGDLYPGKTPVSLNISGTKTLHDVSIRFFHAGSKSVTYFGGKGTCQSKDGKTSIKLTFIMGSIKADLKNAQQLYISAKFPQPFGWIAATRSGTLTKNK